MKWVVTIVVNSIDIIVIIARERWIGEAGSHRRRDIHHSEQTTMEGVERLWVVVGVVFGRGEIHGRGVPRGGAQDPCRGTRGKGQ